MRTNSCVSHPDEGVIRRRCSPFQLEESPAKSGIVTLAESVEETGDAKRHTMGYDCTFHLIDEQALRERFVPKLLGRSDEETAFDRVVENADQLWTEVREGLNGEDPERAWKRERKGGSSGCPRYGGTGTPRQNTRKSGCTGTKRACPWPASSAAMRSAGTS